MVLRVAPNHARALTLAVLDFLGAPASGRAHITKRAALGHVLVAINGAPLGFKGSLAPDAPPYPGDTPDPIVRGAWAVYGEPDFADAGEDLECVGGAVYWLDGGGVEPGFYYDADGVQHGPFHDPASARAVYAESLVPRHAASSLPSPCATRAEFGQRIGWDLFECSDGVRRIQADDDAGRFPDDDAACAFVKALADLGDVEAQSALNAAGSRWDDEA